MRRLAGLALSLAVVACGGKTTCLDRVAPAPDARFVATATPVEGALVVRYADGVEVRVPRPPRRIVSTLPGITATLGWMGAGPAVVGISPHGEPPSGARDVVRLSVMPLDTETLAGLEADLVVVDGVVRGTGFEGVGADGPAILRLETQSLGHWMRSLDLLAAVLDTDLARERAQTFRSDLGRALAAVAAEASDRPPRVLLVAQSEPLYVLGPGSLLDDMLRACGAVNVACDLGRASGPFAEELVLARRPDVVLALGAPLPEAQRTRWGTVPALRRGAVPVLERESVLQAGPWTATELVLFGRLLAEAAEGASR